MEGRLTSLIEADDVLDGVFNPGKVRRKTNTTKDLRAQADRVARGSPEVMVKITGFGRGAQHIQAHLQYITRNAKLELETDRQDVLRDKEAIKDLLGQWMDEIGNSPRHKHQRDTMPMVLSMPEGTPETAVRNAARAYAKRVFGTNHEYVFVLHTDEPHPHVHLTVKMLGFDGKRLNPRKSDLQTWRETFAREMRDQGVAAEATPRSARGVVRKAEKSIVRHIEHGEGRPARVPYVKAARLKEVAEEMIAEAIGQSTIEKPWEARIKQRQEKIRSAWLTAATTLENASPANRRREQINARPEYERLDAARVHTGQRAAAVYQSNLEGLGFRLPAIALARMRDLSRLDVVQHQRPAQVLLHTDAPDRMGRDGRADHDLRRPRTCALTVAGGASEMGNGGRATGDTLAKQNLAATIRCFVQALPAVETERHQLKRLLALRFNRADKREQVESAESEILRHSGPGRTPLER